MPFTKEESIKIGEALKSEMDERLLTEKQVASETGLTKVTICHAVTGKIGVSVKAYAIINDCVTSHPRKRIVTGFRRKNG